jgi:hypothetical protein
MPYRKKTWGSDLSSFPFEITKYNGPIEENEKDKNWFYVNNGVIFKTFSFNYLHFLRIDGLYEKFDLCKNCKVYIEITISGSLQPVSAEIKCTKVNTKENWKYYPFPALIEPEFKERVNKKDNDESGIKDQREGIKDFPWNTGRIIELPDKRIQTKLYILIGYRRDDEYKNGDMASRTKADEEDSGDTNNNDSETTSDNANPVQILKENLILLGSLFDFAPGLVAVPYFYGGLTHLSALVIDEKESEKDGLT